MSAQKRKAGTATISPEMKKSKVLSAAAEPEVEPKRTLYVHNLNDRVKIQTLRENLFLLFSTYGEVLQIDMSKRIRGQAFIVLKTVDEANIALILSLIHI